MDAVEDSMEEPIANTMQGSAEKSSAKAGKSKKGIGGKAHGPGENQGTIWEEPGENQWETSRSQASCRIP